MAAEKQDLRKSAALTKKESKGKEKSPQKSQAKNSKFSTLRIPPGSKPALVVFTKNGENTFIYAGHMKHGKFVGKNAVLKVNMGTYWSGIYNAEIGNCKLNQTYSAGCATPQGNSSLEKLGRY